MKIDLVVTRHPALVEYLKEHNIADETTVVISHCCSNDVRGKHVCGVLPHSLSCLTRSFTEVPLLLPPELRGVELTLDQVREYAGQIVTYRVFTESKYSAGLESIAVAAYDDGCQCAAIIDWEAVFNNAS